MNVKAKFKEYSQDEQVKLLNFFFLYYGKGYLTLEEIEIFKKTIAERGAEKVFELVMAFWITGSTNAYPIQCAIRQQKLDEAFEYIPNVDTFSEEYKKYYAFEEKELLEAIVKDYNGRSN